MKVVIDTNVLLVANGQHNEVSEDCVVECVQRLQRIQAQGVVVIDDNFLILGEYLHKTCQNPPKGPGDKFLKWLLQHSASTRVDTVTLNESANDSFEEFPPLGVPMKFDPADRKFVAVANAHPEKPPIWQAADSKWLDWWPALHGAGVRVEFLCPDDVCRFYRNTFPNRPEPNLPP